MNTQPKFTVQTEPDNHSNSTTKKLFTVIVWQDTKGFGFHRVTPFQPRLVVRLMAKNERAAFNRAVNEFKVTNPESKHGKVLVVHGNQLVAPNKHFTELTLWDTF